MKVVSFTVEVHCPDRYEDEDLGDSKMDDIWDAFGETSEDFEDRIKEIDENLTLRRY